MLRLDASVAPHLEALLLRCRDRADELPAIGRLRSVLPNARIRRSAEGIRIDPVSAHHLLKDRGSLDIRWPEAAKRYVINRHTARASYPAVLDELRSLRAASPHHAKEWVTDSAGLNVLDDHQVVNVAAMTLSEGFGLCLFDEQGAGKTVSLIFAYDLLAARAQADQMIIVAPKSMLPEWPRDFARFRRGLYKVVTVTGSRRQKLEALRSRADIYVTNFETVVAMEAYFEAILRTRPDRSVLVVDESFFVKSPEAKRTRALRRLREWCGRAFVLCGTPAPNSPHDLVEQFNLVDFGIAFTGTAVPTDRTEALAVIRGVVEERGLYVRHLKSEVLPGLPTKRFHRLYVPLRPRQAELYDGLRRKLVADVRRVSESTFKKEYTGFLARRSALLQTCSNPASLVRDYDETPAKLGLLDQVLNEWIVGRREKVVVWSFYRASIDAIVSRYGHFGVLRYDGSVVDVAERGEAVRRFQEDDDVQLLVANPAAAGAGLTLHRARVAIYESLSNQAAHYFQSLDRIHRRGQRREVEYVVLLCQDTLEVAEYGRLLSKERAARQLLGDAATESLTKETFLADLTAEPSAGLAEFP